MLVTPTYLDSLNYLPARRMLSNTHQLINTYGILSDIIRIYNEMKYHLFEPSEDWLPHERDPC